MGASAAAGASDVGVVGVRPQALALKATARSALTASLEKRMLGARDLIKPARAFAISEA